jgi:hypothetical protein
VIFLNLPPRYNISNGNEYPVGCSLFNGVNGGAFYGVNIKETLL